MMRPAPRRSLRAETRRALAIFAVIVWVLGFEIGPGVHVGLHELWGAHAHEGDRGAIGRDDEHDEHVHDHDHDHDHDHVHDHVHDHDHDHDHVHDHDHDHDRGRGIGGEDEGDEGHEGDRGHVVGPGIDRGEHGRHSLAHRGVAVRTPPPAMPSVSSAPWVDAPWIFAFDELVRSRRPSATRARGPPVAIAIV